MARKPLTQDDAMTFWRARDVYEFDATVRGLVVLFFLLELGDAALHGHLGHGLLLVGLQGALLWCLRWGLRWCQARAQAALMTWWHHHR